MEKIEFAPARISLGFLTLFWVGNLAFTVFLFSVPLFSTEWPLVITCAICGLLLLPLVAMMLALCLRSFTRRSLITLTAEGVTDHRISATQLRWQDVQWQTYPDRKGGPEIMVQSVLLNPRVPVTGVFWPYRFLARFYGAIGMPAYPVMPLGTGVSADEIAAAFRKFRKPA